MDKLSTIEGLHDLRQRILEEKDIQYEKPTLVICAGTGGQASGSNDVIRTIKSYMIKMNLQGKIAIKITGCQGFCEMDPFILVQPGNHLYPNLKMEDVPVVVDSAIGGYVAESKIYRDSRDLKKFDDQNDIPFFKKQKRTILGFNEKIDPIRIFNYIEQNGYAAAEKVLSNLDPKWIIC